MTGSSKLEEINPHPPLALYVVWHPDFATGEEIGNLLLDHFGSHRFTHVSGGDRLRVMFRNTPAPDGNVPLHINWDSSETSAVVTLLDNELTKEPELGNYVHQLASEAQDAGFGALLIPVAMEDKVLDFGLAEQAIRWHDWAGSYGEKERRLVRELKYAFIRMLRHRMAELRHSSANRDALSDFLVKVKVFLSHSKHDVYGEPVALRLKDWLNKNADLATFLDVQDIPPGVPFDSVIDHESRESVMVAIYTDSYSSREWCRREVIRAKRLNVPMITVDCLQEGDERSFPYLGNVPCVRMNPEATDRLESVADSIMDEIFKDFLWQCRVEGLRARFPETTFLARAPELISLASRPQANIGTHWEIVYPGPPLGAEETDLFADIAGDVRLLSLIEWLSRREQ